MLTPTPGYISADNKAIQKQKQQSFHTRSQTTSQGQQSTFTLNNQQRIKIIDGVLKDLNFTHNKSELALRVSVSYEPLKILQKPSNFNDPLFQYNILGSKYKNKSRTSNLVSKIQQAQKLNIIAQSNPNPAQKQMEQEDKQNIVNDSQQNSHQQMEEALVSLKHEDNFRYFKDNIICFKCSKVGHYRAVCPQATTCIYCLAQGHDSQSCPQKKVCYRCYQFGHIVAQCNSKQQQYKCNECERTHGIGCNFLISKIKDNGKKNRFYEDIYKDENIKCAQCFQYGHIDCDS